MYQTRMFSRKFAKNAFKRWGSLSRPWSWSRNVSTWSPLGTAFNTKPEQRLNLSFDRECVGLFGIPQLKDYTGFYLLQEGACNATEELVREATARGRTRKIVEVFDQLSDTLCQVADMADFVRVAHPDDQYVNAAEDACVSISALVEKLNTNIDIHRSLKHVITHGDIVETDAIDKRVAELFMFDFEQSGIHLAEDKRRRFVELNERILMLGTQFMQGCQKPTTVSRNMLPKHLQYVFHTDKHDVQVQGLFSDHHSDLIREAAYMAYLHPDQRQMEILELLLTDRHQLARLVGFETYAHRALNGTLANTPENVRQFLDGLADKLQPKAEEDFEHLRKVKLSHGGTDRDIHPWDTAYYCGISRNEVCELGSIDLSPYFSLGGCMEGLSMLFRSLYGVSLEYTPAGYGELWSPDVHKLSVTHETEGILGYIYCDLFERGGKPHQDCHFTIRGGRQMESGTYQNPVVVLMLNLPPPNRAKPSLLTPAMVENLFHEFGHAMHSMLGRTRYQHVTGTRCPTDFAEVPSVLMEYFANDYRVLSTFARHWKTGEALPENLLNRLCQAKQMFAASDMQLQLFYSILDQEYHGKHPLGKTTTELLAEVQNQYYSIPYVKDTAWQQRFGHFVGYGAKYYSYLMSRAVASRIWQHCFKDDPFSRTMGQRFREQVLSHGGGVSPDVLVEAMLSEQPTTDRLVQSLIDDTQN
ncbi:hypothetical protein NP493_457g06007 [Ridgeia piscesae]|uniref:Peptidase M3A/M3B catalytic domain-containing protein n=1 Tax=Ridgeia piscesae TaxID=27915 RepID=A0AAD9L0C6_RIDPI|nr:hypothetical protein NP493_457g06007 [Ridgeia piscesae]